MFVRFLFGKYIERYRFIATLNIHIFGLDMNEKSYLLQCFLITDSYLVVTNVKIKISGNTVIVLDVRCVQIQKQCIVPSVGSVLLECILFSFHNVIPYPSNCK